MPSPTRTLRRSSDRTTAGSAGSSRFRPRAATHCAPDSKVTDSRRARRSTYRSSSLPAVPTTWEPAGEYEDIRYEKSAGDDAGIAKITINRPEVRNAFRPETVIELIDA